MATESTDLNIENTNIKTAPGVELDEHQRTLVASVLDLFAGRPSPKKLQLWLDDASCEDGVIMARGRKQYEAFWYGLETAFSEIEPQHHEVTNSGNPICIHLKTRYVMKGIHMEQTMSSKVNVWYDDATGKIVEIWAPWDGSLPESSFKDIFRRLNPTEEKAAEEEA